MQRQAHHTTGSLDVFKKVLMAPPLVAATDMPSRQWLARTFPAIMSAIDGVSHSSFVFDITFNMCRCRLLSVPQESLTLLIVRHEVDKAWSNANTSRYYESNKP